MAAVDKIASSRRGSLGASSGCCHSVDYPARNQRRRHVAYSADQLCAPRTNGLDW